MTSSVEGSLHAAAEQVVAAEATYASLRLPGVNSYRRSLTSMARSRDLVRVSPLRLNGLSRKQTTIAFKSMICVSDPATR
jgi:hypothetical protein